MSSLRHRGNLIKFAAIALPLMMLGSNSLNAQDSDSESLVGELSEIEITGFADLLIGGAAAEEQTFHLGQAEVDLSATSGTQLSIELAIAHDDGSFVLGTAMAEYCIYSPALQQDDQWSISELCVGGGLFDVPFGRDWQRYASIDRDLISTPLVVESLHDCWNDYGGYIRVSNQLLELTAFGVNGLGCVADEDLSATPLLPDYAIGGRLVASPLSFLAIGGSYAFSVGRNDSPDLQIAGAEIVMEDGGFRFEGEYIVEWFTPAVGNRLSIDGFYAEASYSFARWTGVVRYDAVATGFGGDAPEGEDGYQGRVCFGIGRGLVEGLRVRSEYRADLSGDADELLGQVVFGF